MVLSSGIEVALEFYTALGYEIVGSADFDGASRLVMLAFPEEPEVSLELVHRPTDGPVTPGGCDHLAVQVDDLDQTRDAEAVLARAFDRHCPSLI